MVNASGEFGFDFDFTYFSFFLFGFSFTNIHDSQDSRGRGRLSHWLLFITSTCFISRAITVESSPLQAGLKQGTFGFREHDGW